MKPIAIVALMLGAVLVAGCDNKSQTATTASGRGFELNNVTDQSVNQAESETVTVTIDRKGGYDGPVNVEVTGLPNGVTVDQGATQTILAKDSTIKLKFMATSAAVPSEVNTVTVRASANVDGQTLAKTDTFNLKIKSKT
jgi:predicted aspartyl protease